MADVEAEAVAATAPPPTPPPRPSKKDKKDKKEKKKKTLSKREELWLAGNRPPLKVLRSQRKWDIAKLVMRLSSCVIALAEIGLLTPILADNRNLFEAIVFSISGYPEVGLILLWDIAEMIVILVHRDISHGITPRAHVGVELILWLGSIVTLVLQGLFYPYYTFNYPYYQLVPPETPALGLSAIVLVGVILIFRFIIFVRSCVETDRQNKDERAMKIVFALQQNGRQDPRDVPLSIFKSARYGDPTRFLQAWSSTREEQIDNKDQNDITAPSPPRTGETTLHDDRGSSRELEHKKTSTSAAAAGIGIGVAPASDERDFAMKYSNMPATAYELIEMGIHPEDARNQKVLIGAEPRRPKILSRRSF